MGKSVILPPNVIAKREQLLQFLSQCDRLVVAFSGGVDSAVVAQAAFVARGENAVAVTAVSPSLASGEADAAAEIARQIGISHRFIQTSEMADPNYVRNAGDRCYYCKQELYSSLDDLYRDSLATGGVVVNGANTDDLGDHRPGMQAAKKFDVRSPLIEASLSKDEVRLLAKDWNLPVWDKPASPCLSSRVAYGLEVTTERLARIDKAERYLREKLQIRELRVRHEANDLARIELPIESLSLLAHAEDRADVVRVLRDFGFRFVTIDLAGFRSGSLNEALPTVELTIAAKSQST